MKKIEDKELWSSLNERSRAIETGMDALARKRTGSYYTDIKLTDIMMEELVSQLRDKSKPLYEYRFLEPCVGAGNFVFSYIKAINNTNITKEEATKLLENIYVADVNKEALSGYTESLKHIASEYWDIELEDEYFKTHLGTGLLVDVTKPELEYIGIRDVFSPEIVKDGFDIVATNPPYKNLKAEKSHYNNSTEYDMDKSKYTAISQIVSKQFKYSTSGVLNLYKLFVEEIIDQYANETAYISLLIPASIMSDKTCMKLRSHILKDSRLLTVKVICEGSGYIDAQQALSVMLIEKGKKTDAVKVTKDFCNAQDDIATISIEDILNENTGNAIIAVTAEEYRALKKLRKYPVVKNLDFIINLRGELDLTANKSHITNVDTGFPLIRGRNISYYELQNTETKEYVTDEFISKTKKKCYIERDRIICQQIANMNKERRVTFAYTPANYVLGNSCNFVSVNENKYNIDIYAILGLFNTSIINWLFKLTSTMMNKLRFGNDLVLKPLLIAITTDNSKKNIHSVEEIEKEIAANEEQRNHLSTLLTRGYLERPVFTDAHNKLITEYEHLLAKRDLLYRMDDAGYTMEQKLKELVDFLNGTEPFTEWDDTLFERFIEKVNEINGTITASAQPENCGITHPTENRRYTIREIARIQTFPDDFKFIDNTTKNIVAMYKVIGNAVPCHLAEVIANAIYEQAFEEEK